MPHSRNPDLHGNVPDTSRVALLIIDMLNDFSFPGSVPMRAPALRAAKKIAHLKERLDKKGIPTIYVNDNFGKWRSDRNAVISKALNAESKGREIAELIRPKDGDYFVIKPKHSAFFGTTLDVLLNYLGANSLILTGVATDICIFLTAADAYVRDLHLYVPKDCVATNSPKDHHYSLRKMRTLFRADLSLSQNLVRSRAIRK